MPKQPTPKGPASKGSPDAAAQRQVRSLYAKAVATGSRNATTKKQIANAGLAKLGSGLRAEDVKGKGRSAAAGRRVAEIKKLTAGQRKATNTGRPKSLPKTM